MDKINVSLYGGKGLFKGSRELPVEADIIYCDHFNECDFYKEGKCLNKRGFMEITKKCKYGSVETIKGYTSRAKKYNEFYSLYEKDEAHNKLQNAGDARLANIGDYVYIKTDYVEVKLEDGKIKYMDTNSRKDRVFIPKEQFTADLIYEIISYCPETLLGDGIIRDYPAKVVPNIVNALRKNFKDIYAELIKKHPEYNITPNYVGEFAYIKTMTNGSVLRDHNGNNFTLQDGVLTCDNFNSCLLDFSTGGKTKITIEVSDKEVYKINSNSQCDDNTKFK